MHARFLLGPAGSGKTFFCLKEIRAELRARPVGAPLILLAPKQSTFQLERTLLEDPCAPGEPALAGYTRLQILSFDRLAWFVLDEFSQVAPELLSDEGRVMVLRALLARRQNELEIFRSTARMPGFSLQLSLLLRELQHHQLSPEHLLKLAGKVAPGGGSLQGKLRDLSLILREYLSWLTRHGLEDSNRLLDLAADLLRSRSSVPQGKSASNLDALWMDGFAEMTPQELNLLAAIVPHCGRATLAFCLDAEPGRDQSRLSIWSGVSSTYRNCRERIATIQGCDISVEIIGRGRGRYANAPELAKLEASWASGAAIESTNPDPHLSAQSVSGPAASGLQDSEVDLRGKVRAIRIVSCPDPETEAVMAAREVLRHVRDGGGRYRDTAILLRSLDEHGDALRRVLSRYDIPFFLDRREPVTHHPLAELTRCALRMAAFGWRNDDWFGALKTGLARADQDEIDRLENMALANGWSGRHWYETHSPETGSAPTNSAGETVHRIAGPFRDLIHGVSGEPGQTTTPVSGRELARAIRQLWSELGVEETLDGWSQVRGTDSSQDPGVVHTTVWNQMDAWLDNLERAFLEDALPLHEWLAVVETGLASLTVGILPPAIDQVLVGAIDRSRNPELKLVVLLGVNEGVFPAPPPARPLLTEIERDALADRGAGLGADRWQRLARERYYGYIACTRSSGRLVVSYSERDARGAKLNPSPFVAQLQRIFPRERVDSELAQQHWMGSEHIWELAGPAVRNRNVKEFPWSEIAAFPALSQIISRRREYDSAQRNVSLSPSNAVRLYGRELNTSVSALEDYSACPFKFFVARGMRAEERREFEVDPRERGSFQHEILDRFHRLLQSEGRAWRDLSPDEARERIRQIGRDHLQEFRNGLFLRTETNRFAGGTLVETLERLIGVLVGWMSQYQFDPCEVELGFGLESSQIPGWKLELAGGCALVLRGRIDRVDLHRFPESDEALVVVMDYKSSQRKLDTVKMHHGLQLQLPAYLGVLDGFGDARPIFGVSRLRPAGAFYVDLRGAFESAEIRDEVLDDPSKAAKTAYRHFGRFDGSHLELFDNRGASRGDQFRFALNQGGEFSARGGDAMATENFRAMIDHVGEELRRIGRELYEGRAEVSPFQIGTDNACRNCKFRAVCRFDPWIDAWRILRSPPKASAC